MITRTYLPKIDKFISTVHYWDEKLYIVNKSFDPNINF